MLTCSLYTTVLRSVGSSPGVIPSICRGSTRRGIKPRRWASTSSCADRQARVSHIHCQNGTHTGGLIDVQPCISAPHKTGASFTLPTRRSLTHLNDAGVLHDIHCLNGDTGHLRQQDSSQGIGNGRVNPHQIKTAHAHTATVHKAGANSACWLKVVSICDFSCRQFIAA